MIIATKHYLRSSDQPLAGVKEMVLVSTIRMENQKIPYTLKKILLEHIIVVSLESIDYHTHCLKRHG